MAYIFSSLNSVTHLFLRFTLTQKLFFSTFGSNFTSRPHLTPAPGALFQVSICLSAVFLRPTSSKDQREAPCPLLLQRWPLWNRDDENQCSHWRIKGSLPLCLPLPSSLWKLTPHRYLSPSFWLPSPFHIMFPHCYNIRITYTKQQPFPANGKEGHALPSPRKKLWVGYQSISSGIGPPSILLIFLLHNEWASKSQFQSRNHNHNRFILLLNFSKLPSSKLPSSLKS